MNELERAIENLEDNTDDCYKDYKHLGFWKIWLEKVEKIS